MSEDTDAPVNRNLYNRVQRIQGEALNINSRLNASLNRLAQIRENVFGPVKVSSHGGSAGSLDSSNSAPKTMAVIDLLTSVDAGQKNTSLLLEELYGRLGELEEMLGRDSNQNKSSTLDSN
jgi:hypothetical protein